MKICKIEDCENKVMAKGLCSKHYMQIKYQGGLKIRTCFDKNEIVVKDDYAEIILYKNRGTEEVARVLISKHRIEQVKDIKWALSTYGYAVGTNVENGKRMNLHTILLNPPKGKEIDHINHNPLDCRDENLRICDRKQNVHNTRKLNKNSSSKYKGVYKNKRGRYIVQFKTDSKNIKNTFSDEIVTANYYNHLCKLYRDEEFCVFNDVPFISLEECKSKIILPKQSSTGEKGIRKIESGKFKVSIWMNNKNNYVGTYNTIEEATQAYLNKEKELINN